ncbi:MAG: DUF4350 domain-containing protein, partial [Thermoguttaceae bacterium]
PSGDDIHAKAPGLPSGGSLDAGQPSVLEIVAILVLMLPVAWFAPWPYRAAPAAIIAGLVLGLFTKAIPPGPHRALAGGCVAAGLVLLAQGAMLRLYAAWTSGKHDLPWPAAELLAGLANLMGIDATGDGPMLVMRTLRQTHRLAVTWDLVLDPATIGLLVGGLVTLALAAWSRLPAGERWRAWRGAAGRLSAVVLAWLPLRAMLLVALYLHRAIPTEPDLPLHVMNQFLSPWVHLLLLAPPALVAGRLISNCKLQIANCKSQIPDFKFAISNLQFAICNLLLLAAAALLAVGLQWEPAGTRKQGRVAWVDRHSTWSPTDRPYDTKSYGGGEDHWASYAYTLAYQYLGQFYAMSRIGEGDKIDSRTLSDCDVLIISVPTARYGPDEVDAVVRFVQEGGGLLVVGDHTNFDHSSQTMNEMTRQFGFTFRGDVLYSAEPAPDDERYTAPRVPHPAVQHVPWFDFAVSCSIDPGTSRGRTVIEGTRLWSMPPEYHNANFMPFARHCPEMRCGAFVQAWAARFGEGRILAFADSTVFSSFCTYQPGKAELLSNLIEWLDHQGPALDWSWLALGLGALGLAGAVWWMVRGMGSSNCKLQIANCKMQNEDSKSQISDLKSKIQNPKSKIQNPILLLAAAACGWAGGSMATEAMHRRGMPLPEAQRPLVRIAIDRTVSQAPLAKGPFNEDKLGRGYALLEQWIPRLGYMTVRAAGEEAAAGDALVVICPSRPPEPRYRERLVRYVADGGRLLVIDSGEDASQSTANSLLRPFGLEISYEQNWQGTLVMGDRPQQVRVDHAWEVLGGRPVASLGHERTVAAEARYGKGLVLAVGFGNLFNDAHMGTDWAHYPDETEKARYQALFALVQCVVRGKDEGGAKPQAAPIPNP